MLQVQVKAAWDVEMKIDEKIFTYFESCTSQVDKEGYLYKKVGHFNENNVHIYEELDHKSSNNKSKLRF